MSVLTCKKLLVVSAAAALSTLSVTVHGKASSAAFNTTTASDALFGENKPIAGRNRRRGMSVSPSVSYPKAQTDRLTVRSGNHKVRINVLANDLGSNLRLQRVNPRSAKGGRVFVNQNKVVYIPPVSFSGNDSFWYSVVDHAGHVHSAKVIVCVCDK